MSGVSYKYDPTLVRDSHKWELLRVERFDGGAFLTFHCINPGCTTITSQGFEPTDMGGLCFDKEKAIQLTDRDGNKINNNDGLVK